MEEAQPTQQPIPMQPQKRILATSVRGDITWQMCQPVLEWLIANGDEEARAKAIQTRAYWEQNEGWIIDMLNKNRYFELAEQAIHDPRRFRKVLEMLPPSTSLQTDYYVPGQEEPRKVDTLAWLALVAGERYNERFRVRYKVVGRRKRRK